MKSNIILEGNSLSVLKTLESKSVHTCVTSPPYFCLRDYGMSDQIGLEETPDVYVQKLVEVFREVHRVLRDDGTLWLNLGDSYNGNKTGNTEITKNKTRVTNSFRKKLFRGAKPKDLIGIPWRVAFALQADGWYLRQDIIWHKPNPMPESVTDRCTKAHEYIFLLSKSKNYYFDNEAIKEPAIYGGTQDRVDRAKENGKSMPSEMKNGIRPRDKRAGKGRIAYEGKRTRANGKGDSHGNGQQSFVSIPEMRNKRSVWTITTKPYKDAHFATFPSDLIEPCVLAGAPEGGIVLDPFFGSGTTGAVAVKNNRKYIGIELNPKYIELANHRLTNTQIKLL